MNIKKVEIDGVLCGISAKCRVIQAVWAVWQVQNEMIREINLGTLSGMSCDLSQDSSEAFIDEKSVLCKEQTGSKFEGRI